MLHGGAPGITGGTTLLKRGAGEIPLPPKVTLRAAAWDVLRIATPGGGELGGAR